MWYRIDAPARGLSTRLIAISVGVYGVLAALVLLQSLALNGGLLVYTLDDPYIHLAMVRAWFEWGTVGVSQDHFAMASSSPAWTLALGVLTWLFGLHEWLPYALNVACCLALIVVFWRQVVGDRSGRAPLVPAAAGWLCALAVLVPLWRHLPGLTLAGMEHPLHAALTIAFTGVIFRGLERGRAGVADTASLWLLALLLPLVRLEGAFAVGAGALLLLLRGRLRAGLGVLLIGSAPTALIGLWYQRMGGFLLPNSIVAKAVPATGLFGWLEHLVQHLTLNLAMDQTLAYILLLGLYWLYRGWKAGRRADVEQAAYVLVLVTLHLGFSVVGWFERYQAYLITLFVFMAVRRLPDLPWDAISRAARRRPAVAALSVVVVLVCFGSRQLTALWNTAAASNNIFVQQYQMGRFVAEHYRDRAVVVNDLGVVSLRATGPVTDPVGLGSTDVLREAQRVGGTHKLTGEIVEPLLDKNGADVIIVYPGWFDQDVYGRWRAIGSWSITGQLVTPAARTVVFYTRDERTSAQLARRLRAFEPELPPGVRVDYYGGMAATHLGSS
jgi:hypothetical protein